MQSQYMPIVILLLAGIAVFLLWSNEQKYTADEGRLSVYLDPSRDAAVLRWGSPIEAPMARRFEEAFREHKDDTSLFIVDLDSPGGALAEGKRVIRLLERIKQTHALETRVRAGADCLSMCAPIFLEGQTRIAASSARFMFHEPSKYDSFTGERSKEPSFEKRFTADRFFERYFENSPMSPEWRAWLEREWVGKDVWKTGEELVAENSGVVTVLE